MESSRNDVARSDDADDDGAGGDDPALDADEGSESDRSGGSYSSSQGSYESDGEPGEDGDDDSIGGRSREESDDDRRELYEMEDDLGDDDAPTQRSARHRAIILILAALLAMLLVNFSYQLIRISRASRSDSPPLKNVDVESVEEPVEPKITPRNRRNKKVSQDDGNATASDDERGLNDDVEYRMPQHPSRIYTHVALGGNRYRAGGVLSDEMLRRYEEDGALVILNLVSPKLLDRLDEASRMLIDGQDEASKKKKRGKQFHMVKNSAIFLGVPRPKDDAACDAADGDATTCEVDAESEDSDENAVLSSFRDLAMYSKISLVAASLLRLDELHAGGEQYLKLSRQQKLQQGDEEGSRVDDSINLRICRDIFLTKDDDPYACGWHTDDTGFWPAVASDPGVNAWVALDDMPWPWSGTNVRNDQSSSKGSNDGSSHNKTGGSVATFALSLGSHRAPWRHEAYRVTGSTHTVPTEGYESAADLVQRRSGSGTCNIQTSAPHLYEKLEENKVIYDLKRGDVIFHDRWVFHRTVTADEYSEMARENHPAPEQGADGGARPASSQSKIFRRYSIRYAPGTATVPPGYGVEPSVLHDGDNAGRTLDDVAERSGPWYPRAWPRVLKEKPLQSVPPGARESEEEEIEGLGELVHRHMPRAERLQKERKREIQRLVSMRGGP